MLQGTDMLYELLTCFTTAAELSAMLRGTDMLYELLICFTTAADMLYYSC